MKRFAIGGLAAAVLVLSAGVYEREAYSNERQVAAEGREARTSDDVAAGRHGSSLQQITGGSGGVGGVGGSGGTGAMAGSGGTGGTGAAGGTGPTPPPPPAGGAGGLPPY
jgi:hypothetical protein